MFWNKAIGRRLDIKGAREVLEGMRKEGRIEWIGRGGVGKEKEGGEFWVWWRNLEEWAGVVYDWVCSLLSFRFLSVWFWCLKF